MDTVTITQLTERASIFYFPYFIYFAEDEQERLFQRDAASTLQYLTLLLCVFDKILIPSEQISLSTSDDARHFKAEVLSHPWFKDMVRYERIITTIWGCCNDLDEHIEATDRYTQEIGAGCFRDTSLITSLPCLPIYRRDASHQSKQAGGFLKNANLNGIDELIYTDGLANIPFSHEKLLLTDFAQKFKWNEGMMDKAKRAYIQAMPVGNGAISRPLVGDKIELPHSPLGFFSDGQIAIHPGLLVPSILTELLQARLGFPRLGENQFDDSRWRREMIMLLFESHASRFRKQLFNFFVEASKSANGPPPDLKSYIIPRNFLGDVDQLKNWGTAAALSILGVSVSAPIFAICSPFLVPMLTYFYLRAKTVHLDHEFISEFVSISKVKPSLALSA